MKYFEKEEIRDQLLADMLTEEDIADADNYIDDLAQSLNVEPRDIVIPTPYKVKQLAMSYALMICARGGSIMNERGADGNDAYEIKRRVYQREIDRLTSAMTVQILTGQKSNAAPGVITLERA